MSCSNTNPHHMWVVLQIALIDEENLRAGCSARKIIQQFMTCVRASIYVNILQFICEFLAVHHQIQAFLHLI
jgi:hypothetical protein